MEIARILKRLEDSTDSGIKTASAAPSPTSPSAEALRSELRQAINTVAGEEKTASAVRHAPSPTADLVKMASDLATAEDEAMMKQAQVYGAAICDGFMTRYAQYEQAASEVTPTAKTAQIHQPQQPSHDDFNKFAEANPELVKEAYELGYHTKMAELRKQANERFEAGYNDTMQEVHKIASAVYKHGAEWGQWAVKTAEHQAQH